MDLGVPGGTEGAMSLLSISGRLIRVMDLKVGNGSGWLGLVGGLRIFLANKGGTTVSRPFAGVGPFCIRFDRGSEP